MKLVFDIDNTITRWDDSRDYVNFVPDEVMVKYINDLYDAGHTIVLYTARGMTSVGPSNIDKEIVPSLLTNLDNIGLKYHELMTHKPSYDFIIDDKALRPDEFKTLIESDSLLSHKPYTIGI